MFWGSKKASIPARSDSTSEFLLVRNEKDISAKDLVIRVTVFHQDPFSLLNFYPAETLIWRNNQKNNKDLEKDTSQQEIVSSTTPGKGKKTTP